MRKMPNYERKKRGCLYCNDGQTKQRSGAWKVECPFAACPYHVLDKYNSYDEFLASEDGKILVNEFFVTIESIFELARLKSQTICKSDDSY